jgi:hypothetical protein
MNGTLRPLTAVLRAATGATALALLLGSPATSEAAGWRFSITPYAWATDMGVDATLDGREIVDEDIPVGDLIDDIETIFQLRFEATRGAFGLMADVFDVTLADDASGVALPDGAGDADLSSEVGMTILDLAAGWDPNGDRQGLGVIGGVRILDERASIDATVRPASAPGASLARSYDGDDTTVDALLGLRFATPLSRHFAIQMQADASAGGTDYTWSIGPTLSYGFGTMNRFGVQAGWRRMELDFADENGVDTRMTLSGFQLGLRTSF